MTTPAALHPGDLLRPRLRGVLHQWAFVVCLATGTVLVAVAPTARGRIAGGIYALSLLLLFGTSAAYHRGNWGARAKLVMKRLDHSMIFVFIAGSYTPFALMLLHGSTQVVVLSVVWGGAGLGVLCRMLFLHAPRYTYVPLYLALGWTAAFIIPQLLHAGGVATFTLICVGGAAYTLGGVVYAARRPDPVPTTFGYHEVFHAMTCVAAICHYIAVSLAVYAVTT